MARRAAGPAPDHPVPVDPVAELTDAYRGLLAVLGTLAEDDGWRATGCAGWTVRDLTLHLCHDAQRALVALATPASGPVDTDAVSYWLPWRPDSEGAHAGRRFTRIVASVWSTYQPLRELYEETALAVLHQAPGDEPSVVRTQGRTMRRADLLVTLAVEAAVHHVDLIAWLDRPGPGNRCLGAVRRTLDGLLGRPAPADWDDLRYLRLATGRAPLSAAERTALGAAARRLPLFG